MNIELPAKSSSEIDTEEVFAGSYSHEETQENTVQQAERTILNTSNDENAIQRSRPINHHAAAKGMAFLLQQMRSATPKEKDEPTSITDSSKPKQLDSKEIISLKRNWEDSAKEDNYFDAKIPRLDVPKLDAAILYEFPMKFPSKQDTSVNGKGAVEKLATEDLTRFDYNNLSITINVEPIIVVRDCFYAKTTPNFRFSEKVTENNYVRSCKWRPDGMALLTESEDRRVRLFRFDEAQKLELAATVRLSDLIYDIQWHPQKDLFATTSRATPIHLWSTDGQRRLSFRGINHLDELAYAYSLGFSLNGSSLYAGYYKMLRIFDLERPGRHIRELRTFDKSSFSSGQKAILSSIATCPTMDGVYAVGSFGGSVGLYSDHTQGCDSLFSTQNMGITHMQYTSDGNQLFVGYRKSTIVECFDLRFPVKVLSSFYRPADTNQRFYFQLDRFGRYLFSGSSLGTILIYDLKDNNNFATNGNLIAASWAIPAGKTALPGLSIHPTKPIVATCSGERVFPRPSLCKSSESSSEDNISMDDENAKEDMHDRRSLVRCLNNLEIDNALKLWKI